MCSTLPIAQLSIEICASRSPLLLFQLLAQANFRKYKYKSKVHTAAFSKPDSILTISYWFCDHQLVAQGSTLIGFVSMRDEATSLCDRPSS
eukprot:5349540-Amphidinium_carterae.1